MKKSWLGSPCLFFWQPQSEVSEISARGQRAQAELEKSRVDFETRVAGFWRNLNL